MCSELGVAPVPAEVRPLRPRTVWLSFEVLGSAVASLLVSFPRLVRQAFERLEPCEGKLSCTVLRGGIDGNVGSPLDQVLTDGKTKQPYYITLNDQDIFGFAALWDSSKRDDGVTVESCTIVTMPANALMTEIHNVKHRMPAILTKEDRDAWLTTTPDDAFKLLRQYPDTHMVATPVSKRVNTPKNNDAELIAPASVA